ncbi:MAG TPA: alanine racemase [Desulfobacterales bacterium]|nr:alanine racemase [Desulfobacterales bacterium]
MSLSSYNSVSINLTALRHNFQLVKKMAGPDTTVLTMVKSDAYGHGLVPVAESLSAAGAGYFGVASPEEGVSLRRAGLKGTILVLLGSVEAEPLIDYNLTPVVFELENIRALSAAAVRRAVQIGVHLKMDVGMGRLGIMPAELCAYVREIESLPGVYLDGIMAHFPLADTERQGITRAQDELFRRELDKLSIGRRVMCHIANSAALIRFADTHHDMVRLGIALYGYSPLAGPLKPAGLEAVMSLRSRVIQLKDVPAGYGISYGHIFKTKVPSRLAVLPLGYADGYLRSLSGRASVLIRGRRAPVRGRICMNACVADVTEIPGVENGDEVVIMGRQQWGAAEDEITADEIASWMGTINYEVLCLFGSNNKRRYI